jgi:hypothetical protein
VVSSEIGDWETAARLVRARESSGRFRDIILAVLCVVDPPNEECQEQGVFGASHGLICLPSCLSVSRNPFFERIKLSRVVS